MNVFRKGSHGYNIFRIPAVVRAANGDILAFCEAREGGDASTIDLVLKRSTDGGRSWGALEMVQDHQSFRSLFDGEPPPITVGNPAPVVDLLDPDRPGRIWLPFTLENDRVFVIHSDDHGRSWRERREITEEVKRDRWGWYATGPVHAIQIQQGAHRGRLVVPADHRHDPSETDRGAPGAHAFLSDDHGRTWRLGAVDDTYSDDLHANETAVVELADGRLYFNTRDQSGAAPGTRGAAYSRDGGESFDRTTDTAYATFVPLGPPFDPPVVQCSLLRIRTAVGGRPVDLVLFSGPDEDGPTGPGRSDLRLRYSTDQTRTWRDGPLIHVGPAAYSDLVLLEPHIAGILFEAGDPGTSPYDRIDFIRFDVRDLFSD